MLKAELYTVQLTPSMSDLYFLVIWKDSGNALSMPPGGVKDLKQECHLCVSVYIQTCYVSVVYGSTSVSWLGIVPLVNRAHARKRTSRARERGRHSCTAKI